MAEPALVGPFGKFDLADELRVEPCALADVRGQLRKGLRHNLQGVELLADLGQGVAVEAGADLAGEL